MMTANPQKEIQTAYAEALALQNAGKLEAALLRYRTIVRDHPRVAEAQYQIGMILNGRGDHYLAVTHLLAAAQLRSGEGMIWKALTEAVALGGTAEAERTYLDLLRNAPVPPAIKVALQDQFGARRASTRPKTGGVVPAEIRRLLTLMEGRRYAEVEKAGERVLQLHPQSAIVANIVATAQAFLGRKAAAEASYRKAIAIDGSYAEAHDNYGRLLIERGQEAEAERQFRQAVQLAPGLPSALVNYASVLIKSEKYDHALVLLDRALASGADILPGQLAKGNALMRLKRYAEAEACFRKTVELSQGKVADPLGMHAQSLARLGRDDEAMVVFDKALAIDPDFVVATSGKAALLQALGQFEEAEELFRKTIRLDPTNGENYRVFVASYKAKAGDPIIDEMIKLYDNSAATSEDRMNLGFAIAKALEDAKDYGRVFKYLDAANAEMSRRNPFDMANRHRVVELTQRAYRGFDWSATKIPNATDCGPIFITGMPRSGTTLVEQIISSHSTVTGGGEVGEVAQIAHRFMALGRDVRQLQDVPREEISELGHKMASVFRRRFPHADRMTDKSIQSYMHMGLIRLAIPNARFVVVRRDPRDNLLSMYKNKFPDDAHTYSYNQRALVEFYDTFLQMTAFWREQAPDWYYEVEYEALVANPEPETRKLIAACNLTWEDACLRPQDNDRKVETLSVFQARQPISKGSVKGWKRYERDLAPMLDELRKRGLVTE
jgi:tetratricopeptide (TPR) repeat protein